MNLATACSSSANLGPGFDVLSIALDAYHETTSIRLDNGPGKGIIRVIDHHNKPISESPSTVVARRILSDHNISDNVTLITDGNIPWSSGLGSSGASSAAAAILLNDYYDLRLSPGDLVNYSLLGEEFISGSKHPDNVLASLFGGFIIIKSINPLKFHSLKIHRDLKFIIILIRSREINKTKHNRSILPHSVSLSDSYENSRNLALLLHGLTNYDSEMISEGMCDNIVEAARSKIYTFYPDLKRELLLSGALGVAISGGGPSVLCIVDTNFDVAGIQKSAEKVLKKNGIEFAIKETRVCRGGLNERRN